MERAAPAVGHREIVDALAASIPEECAICPDHAHVHICSMNEALEGGDTEQAVHDAAMAGAILLVWAARADAERCAARDPLP